MTTHRIDVAICRPTDRVSGLESTQYFSTKEYTTHPGDSLDTVTFRPWLIAGALVVSSAFEGGEFLSSSLPTDAELRLSDATVVVDGQSPGEPPLPTRLSYLKTDLDWKEASVELYSYVGDDPEPAWSEFTARGVRRVSQSTLPYSGDELTIPLSDPGSAFDVRLQETRYRGSGAAVRVWNLGADGDPTVHPQAITTDHPAGWVGEQGMVFEFRVRMFDPNVVDAEVVVAQQVVADHPILGGPAYDYDIRINKSTRRLSILWFDSVSLLQVDSDAGIFPESVLSDFEFHHFAIARMATTQVRFYFDGELVDTQAVAPSGYYAGEPQYLRLFSAGTASSVPSVDFDEVRVWRGQRTDAEILANAFSVLSGKELALCALYKFGEWWGSTSYEEVAYAGEPNLGDPVDALGRLPAHAGQLPRKTERLLTLDGTTGRWAKIASGTAFDFDSGDAFSVRATYVLKRKASTFGSSLTIAQRANHFRIYVDSADDKIKGSAWVGGGWQTVTGIAVGTAPMMAGVPLFVELVWDGTANTLTLYYTSGALASPWSLASAQVGSVAGVLGSASGNDVWIGSTAAASGNSPIWIAELGFFSAARGSAAIGGDWQTWLDPSLSGLEAYYRLEGDGLNELSSEGANPVVVSGDDCWSTSALDLRALTWVSTFEGDESLVGKPKPVAGGYAQGCSPDLIDAIGQVYQVHEGSVNRIVVRQAGAAMTAVDVGGPSPVLEPFALSTTKGQITGTVSVSGTALTGSGTVFLSELVPNEAILIEGEVAVVASITDDENAVLWNDNMTSQSGVACYRDRPMDGECVTDLKRGLFRLGLPPYGVLECDLEGDTDGNPLGTYTENGGVLLAWVALRHGLMTEAQVDKTASGLGDWDASPTTGFVAAMAHPLGAGPGAFQQGSSGGPTTGPVSRGAAHAPTAQDRRCGFHTGLEDVTRREIMDRLATSGAGFWGINFDDGKLTARQVVPGTPTRTIETRELIRKSADDRALLSSPVSEIQVLWAVRQVTLAAEDLTAVPYPSIEFFQARRTLSEPYLVERRANPSPLDGAEPLIVETYLGDQLSAAWLADILADRYFGGWHVEEYEVAERTGDLLVDTLQTDSGRLFILLAIRDDPEADSSYSLIFMAEDREYVGGTSSLVLS